MEDQKIIPPPFGLSLIFFGIFAVVFFGVYFFYVKEYSRSNMYFSLFASHKGMTQNLPQDENLLLPAGALLPGATIIHNYGALTTAGNEQETLVFTTPQIPSNIFTYYTSYLIKNGWFIQPMKTATSSAVSAISGMKSVDGTSQMLTIVVSGNAEASSTRIVSLTILQKNQ